MWWAGCGEQDVLYYTICRRHSAHDTSELALTLPPVVNYCLLPAQVNYEKSLVAERMMLRCPSVQ
jgi:hypothetical protein